MADTPNQPEKDEKKDKTAPIRITSADKKSDTTRIDLSSAKPPPSITDKEKLPPDADDYFKRSTMRIEPPPGAAKAETAKISLPPEPGEEKKQTSKLDMSAAAKSSDDVFKSKTIPVGVPTPPPAAPARPKTIQLKRPSSVAAPGESIIVSPETTASATEEARKSETARIDLSSEDANRPATRPKTIRIKRPDGTSGRKALTITRPEGEAEETATQTSVSPKVEGLEEEQEAGMVEVISAAAALVVVGVLFYVLLAQTLAPTLPFPGRI